MRPAPGRQAQRRGPWFAPGLFCVLEGRLGRHTVKELVKIFGRNHPYRQEQKAFWACLAAFEASRQFNPLAGCCGSELCMDTHGEEPGCMRWAYRTTSGTLIECSEPREHQTQESPGYPGVECSDELHPAYFRVTIPADRDQAGRYHHDQLKNGGAYCE